MNVRYRVELNQTERTELEALLSGGEHAARKLKRAQILLAADAGSGDEAIAKSIGVADRPCCGPSAALIKWMFTTEKARAKMARAYPQPACTQRPQLNES